MKFSGSGLTSLHESVEHGGVDEEEEVGAELQRDVRVHLEGLGQFQGFLQHLQDAAEPIGQPQLTAL